MLGLLGPVRLAVGLVELVELAADTATRQAAAAGSMQRAAETSKQQQQRPQAQAAGAGSRRQQKAAEGAVGSRHSGQQCWDC